MRIAQVIGTVTLSRVHPSLRGESLRLVTPLSADQLAAGSAPGREALVAVDAHGAGRGQLVAIAEGAEAAAPYYPNTKPVDATVVALLDDVQFTV